MPALTAIALRDAAFSYDSAAGALFSGLNAYFPVGFTGVVGANGAGKTTLLRVLVGELSLSAGFREGPGNAVYCAQRTDLPPDNLQEFLEDWDSGACELKNRLAIAHDYCERWDSLSHGERKRAQIAEALSQAPSVLAIDEPTNHIDAPARQLLIDALAQFKGIGIIVSHDRALLDELCCQCLWLEPPDARLYQGGITQAQEQRYGEHETQHRRRKKLLAESRRLKSAETARRDQASREHAARSKKHLSRKDSDAREKTHRARVTDGNAGSGLRQLKGRSRQLKAELASVQTNKVHTTGVCLEGSYSRRDAILRLAAGQLKISDDRVLTWPDVLMKPQDRIAIGGENGAGKSTWIKHIVSIINAPEEQILYLPQEITAAASRNLHNACQALSQTELGQVMTIVSRLSSRPEQLLNSRQPSPGEARKLAIALGMLRRPHIIVLDEPTNHLDLPSVQALEQALADCHCALIVVSHDHHFIENTTSQTWKIDTDAQGNSSLSTGL